jgi:hypothetical protein
MPSSRTGHFVQIWRPPHDAFPEKVVVEGRSWLTTVNPEVHARYGGWSNVSRELPFRRARRFAKAYARAGFPARVLFRGNDGKSDVVLELRAHRRKK